jgi:hypothetical protein
MAQLVTKTKCPDFVVDILTESKWVKASAPDYDISESFLLQGRSHGSSAKCGGGVFIKTRIFISIPTGTISRLEKIKGKMTIH